MSPHCVWLVIVGGYKGFEWKDFGGGVKKPWSTYIIDTNRLIIRDAPIIGSAIGFGRYLGLVDHIGYWFY